MCLKRITFFPVFKAEERKFGSLMQKHHYLGLIPKILTIQIHYSKKSIFYTAGMLAWEEG